MQAAVVNPYITIPAANGAKDATAGDSANGQAFSAMLGDAQLGADDSTQDQASADHLSDVSAPVASGALAAQEVGDESTLEDLLAQEVTPENVADLIADLDLALQQGSEADKEILQALKTELLAVQKTGETTSVAALLQQVNATQPQLTADAGVSARMLHWLQTALARKTGKQELLPQDTATAATAALGAMSAAMQSLQAGLFRPDDAADAGSQDAQKGSQEGDVAISFVPLAQLTLIQMPLVDATTLAPTTGALDAGAEENLVPLNGAVPVPDDILASALPPMDLDAAIPPLDIAKTETSALPEVDLPSFTDPIVKEELKPTSQKTEAQPTAPLANTAATLNPTLASHIQSMSQAMTPKAQADDSLTPSTTANGDALSTLSATAASSGATPTQTANAVQAATAVDAPAKPLAVPVSEQVHVAIKQATGDGADKITIQLDPVELGRVEVKMQVAQDGQTQISFTVDKPSTFDALSRDVRSLERSLQDAGIKADAGSMQFNLRQSPQQMQSNMGGQGQSGGQNQRQARADEENAAIGTVASAAATKHYSLNLREGVDIRA